MHPLDMAKYEPIKQGWQEVLYKRRRESKLWGHFQKSVYIFFLLQSLHVAIKPNLLSTLILYQDFAQANYTNQTISQVLKKLPDTEHASYDRHTFFYPIKPGMANLRPASYFSVACVRSLLQYTT